MKTLHGLLPGEYKDGSRYNTLRPAVESQTCNGCRKIGNVKMLHATPQNTKKLFSDSFALVM